MSDLAEAVDHWSHTAPPTIECPACKLEEALRAQAPHPSEDRE